MNLLEIQTSVRQDGSVSRTLASKFIHHWQRHQVQRQITVQHQLRDLGQTQPAMITGAWVGANLTPTDQRTAAAQATLAESDQLIAELFAADRIVLGVPMYNMGIPAHLKAYFDNVIRMGRTMGYDRATGETHGLLTGKKAVIISSRAGYYAPGTPGAAIDFCLPYVQFLLNYLGIADVTTVEVPHQADGNSQRQAATDAAIAQLLALAIAW